jgi:hypothetical protein
MQGGIRVTRHVKTIAAPIAVLLILALTLTLAFGAQAVGKTGAVQWICIVPGEDEPVTFVSAPEAARHGIEQANSRAGVVFNERFGEVCHVE